MAFSKLKKAAYYATGVAGLRPDDVLLSSFPRSGNTWVRFLLCNLISLHELNGETIDFPLLNKMMPELGANYLLSPWRWNTLPRVVKTHRSYLPFFSKCRTIGLVRDPRDVMVSYFHYVSHRKRLFSGPFSQFIRTTKWGLPAWFTHYSSWTPHWTMLVHYEELKENPLGELERLLTFLGITLPAESLQQAVDRASASKVEPRNAKEPGEPDQARFVRSTAVNQWQDYFGEEDLAYYRVLAAKYCYLQAEEAISL